MNEFEAIKDGFVPGAEWLEGQALNTQNVVLDETLGVMDRLKRDIAVTGRSGLVVAVALGAAVFLWMRS